MNHYFKKSLRTSKNIHKRKQKKRSAKAICKNILLGIELNQSHGIGANND